MFKAKIKSISIRLLPLLLALFVLSQSVSLVHGFSHHGDVQVSHEGFFSKIFFGHSGEKMAAKNHCSLCSFANFQNQIFLSAELFFCAAFFHLAFFTRFFDRVKLSYILANKASRAPPSIS